MLAAVAGHDAVIVCLGSTGLRDKSTLATGTATIVRSAVLTDRPATGAVTATTTGATKRISRADLAGFLVDQLGDDSHTRRAVSVTS